MKCWVECNNFHDFADCTEVVFLYIRDCGGLSYQKITPHSFSSEVKYLYPQSSFTGDIKKIN